MYTTTALIIWALIALVIGFAAGYMTCFYRSKIVAGQPGAVTNIIKLELSEVEGFIEEKINELKQHLSTPEELQPKEAQSDASKKL